jgi:hypothetical protein
MESQNKKREKNARGERRIEEELALLTVYTCCRRKQLDLGVMEKRGRSIAGDVCREREKIRGALLVSNRKEFDRTLLCCWRDPCV